jgi:hypothetical protein
MRETNPVNSLELIGEFAVGVKKSDSLSGTGRAGYRIGQRSNAWAA